MTMAMNSEFITSIADDECHIFMVKNFMMQRIVAIPKTNDDPIAFTEGVRPLACVDNAGSMCVTYRGGGLKLSVWTIENL